LFTIEHKVDCFALAVHLYPVFSFPRRLGSGASLLLTLMGMIY